jgi:hypothetical protein
MENTNDKDLTNTESSIAFFKNAKQIFLGALEVPEYARAEYYAKKQIESGWGNYVFFTALHEVYHSYIYNLEWEQKSLKNKARDTEIEIEDVNLSLEKETGGRKQGNLNKEVLDNLFDIILIAPKYLAPEPDYSAMQIFSFIERTISFIRDEFNTQLRLKKIPPINGKKTIYTIKDFEEAYCFTPFYFIKNSTPFFDFERFKVEARNLLLYSPHPENLQKILTPFYDAALKNLTLWNAEIHILDRDKKYNDKHIMKEDKRLEFEIKGLKVLTNLEDFQRFTRYNVERYSNYDFAIFCNNVAGFIGSDVLKYKKHIPGVKQSLSKFTLNDFFKETSPQVIEQIQNTFKDYTGKKMAILIYLLQTTLKKIKIINRSKTQSKKQFVVNLTGDNDIQMQSINKVFQPGTDKLLGISETDVDYINTIEKLNKLLVIQVVWMFLVV